MLWHKFHSFKGWYHILDDDGEICQNVPFDSDILLKEFKVCCVAVVC